MSFTGSTPTSNCDFEDVKMCGYLNDTNDDFDWSRKSGRTASRNTGPTSDHTLGTLAGNALIYT